MICCWFCLSLQFLRIRVPLSVSLPLTLSSCCSTDGITAPHHIISLPLIILYLSLLQTVSPASSSYGLMDAVMNQVALLSPSNAKQKASEMASAAVIAASNVRVQIQKAYENVKSEPVREQRCFQVGEGGAFAHIMLISHCGSLTHPLTSFFALNTGVYPQSYAVHCSGHCHHPVAGSRHRTGLYPDCAQSIG